jgi:peroxiredoxin
VRHILLTALLLPVTGLTAAPPKVGERHPDFTLPNIDTGKPQKLSDFRGKKVLLVQFASW